MGQAADFFVSYTGADLAWAEWIAWQLEAEGYNVVMQAWDFSAGRDWVHEMQQAASTAKRVVAVLSSQYLDSTHGEAEWRVFYAKDPSGGRGLLLPVRVGRVEPPGLLTTRIYVDLVDKDAASARQALLAAARGARGKPTEEPKYPGGQQRTRNVTEAPRFPGELPPVWNLPYHPNPYFTGRDLLSAAIHARLTAADADRRRVVLTGLGGVGKTQLAAEYAYRQRADYDLVWWVHGEQSTSRLSDYAALASQPPLAADLELGQRARQELLVAKVRSWLERNRRWLLIFDNVEDLGAITELLPRSATGHVLVTSQTETGWEPLAHPLRVEVLAPTAAAEFLLARTSESGSEALAAAITVATTLGALPLALEQAAAYSTAAGTISLADYAELFATRALELLKQGQPLGYQHTVATTWSLALQNLQETNPAAVGLLTLAAFLAPDDLPRSLVAGHADRLPEPLARAASDPLALANAVAALRRYSLVRVIGDGLSVHRLLQTVVRAALGDLDDERAWAAAAVLLLRAGFPESSDEVATWGECQRLLPHALTAVEQSQRLGVEPEQGRRLLQQAAIYLQNRGHFYQSKELAERIVAWNKRDLGLDHPDTLLWINNLGQILHNLGDRQGTLNMHEQALAGLRRVLGDDHPATLITMDSLALARRYLADLHGARELHEQALAGLRRVLGEDHPATLISMNNFAEVRRHLGDLVGARELHKQALAGMRRVLGNDHRHTLTSMNNLAVTFRVLGDLHGARELQEQTLDGLGRVLGNDHSRTLVSIANLGVIYRHSGDLHGALELHERARAGSQKARGDDHLETLASADNLALTRRALGDLHGAHELFASVLENRRRLLGPDSRHTLASMNNLAAIRQDVGDLNGARQLLEDAVAAYRRVLGNDYSEHPEALVAIDNLAMVCRALGDLPRARALHEESVTGFRRVFGDSHPDTLQSMNNLAEALCELEQL